MKKGKLFCLIGLSAVGKTTVRNYIIEQIPAVKYIPSYTTRLPRANEVDGRDYHFVSEKQFENLIREGELIEWEKHYGNYYGLSRNQFWTTINGGFSVIKEIAIGGYNQILKAVGDKSMIYTIYIMPENINELPSRLNSDEHLTKDLRLRNFDEELASKVLCDITVVSKQNQILPLCVEVKGIILNQLEV